MTWELDIASPDLAERARTIRAEVRPGGCNDASAEPLYAATFPVDGAGPELPPLGPGTYAFAALALDGSCIEFADGCVEVELPTEEPSISLLLDERFPQTRHCEASACNDGVCDDSEPVMTDAGMPDAGRPVARDAGVDSAMHEADGGPFDAGPPIVPSNIPGGLLLASEADIVLTAADGDVRIDTSAGTIVRASDGADLAAGAVHTTLPQAGGAPDLSVFSARSIVIEEGVLVIVIGEAALVLAATEEVRIDGVIDASGGRGSQETPGPGGFAGGNADSVSGAGPGGGELPIEGAGQDVGGGGGGFGAVGGTGGTRAVDQPGGVGGSTYGGADLVPLFGGSGGTRGGGGNSAGNGGGGGGAVQVSAASIVVGPLGGINVGGAGGERGHFDDAAGGGGSGGGILLEAITVRVMGVLAANGGGGGSGADVRNPGETGQGGRLGATPAAGGAGAGEGSAGGDGGATGHPEGSNGEDRGDAVDPETGDFILDNLGGGGGGSGRIRLRGSTIDVTGTLSPTEVTTQAPL